jgi:hypothetical protein
MRIADFSANRMRLISSGTISDEISAVWDRAAQE